MMRKRFILTFLLSGVTYAILTLIIDKAEVAEIISWRFLVKATIFGFFIALANTIVRDEFKSKDKQGS